jgi:hypothetical protein
MNKIQIKKMITKQTRIIAQVNKDMALSRWERSKAFAEIHGMVIWSKSPYKTFKDFVKEVFPDTNPGTAYFWVINYTQMTKWYSWSQIQTMSKSISYTRAVAAQQTWGKKRKVSIVKFIKFAKSLNVNTNTIRKNVPNPNRLSLILPTLYVEKFEGILANHGYIIPKDRNAPKHGISDAMVKYLDTI